MTKSTIVWKCFIVFGYMFQPVYTGATRTSKACYGAPGYYCTQHDISCSITEKIAIYDAYYTGNTECGAGLASCAVNPDNVTEHGYHRFNTAELVTLYSNCSTETRCVYRAHRRSAALAFSVVKYQCIKEGELLNTSGGVAWGLSQVSFIHRENMMSTSAIETIKYMCTFKSDVTATSISVYALDARLGRATPGQCFSKLSVLPGNEITMNSCSSVFQPFQRLNVTAELPISLNFEGFPRSSSALIWLLINASDTLNVTCQAVTGAGGLTTGSIEYSSSISPSSQFPVRLTTKSTGDESIIPTSSQFPVGLFVGGMAVGAVIVILVGLAVYVLVVRRRYDLTTKKQGDIPASVEHPTYSGLSAGGDVNNYDIIEQTSGFQGDTAHEVAATQDYQNV